MSIDEQLVLGGMHICRPKPFKIDKPSEEPIGLRLMSDLHIGAAHVDYALIKEELDDAAWNQDRILLNGDVFDMILPKDTKRYKPSTVHPRIARRDDQVDAAVDWGVELLGPVAHLIDMIGTGNHEAVITHYHSTDPILRLLVRLEMIAKERDPEHVIHYGGYTGFVDYRLRARTKGKGGSRWVLYYHHGSGGAAPVTKGLIDFNRKDVFIDADMIWMGHRHHRLQVAVEKLRCPQLGDEPDVRSVRHLQTGAYFQTYRGQSQSSVRQHGRISNYAADMGLAPGGRGGARVLLKLKRGDKVEVSITQ